MARAMRKIVDSSCQPERFTYEEVKALYARVVSRRESRMERPEEISDRSGESIFGPEWFKDLQRQVVVGLLVVRRDLSERCPFALSGRPAMSMRVGFLASPREVWPVVVLLEDDRRR
jgi:hypothetical protein